MDAWFKNPYRSLPTEDGEKELDTPKAELTAYLVPRRGSPSRDTLLLSTLYTLLVAAVAVCLSRTFWPVGLPMDVVEPIDVNASYYEWLTVRMAQSDPFDELDRMRGVGVGPLERSMWGLHEQTGWEQELYNREKGYDEIPMNKTNYRLHYNSSESGVKDLWSFSLRLPLSVQTAALASVHAHLPESLKEHLPSLPSGAESADIGPRGMINYKNIFQTDKKMPQPDEADGKYRQMWHDVNAPDGWILEFFDDTQAEEWVHTAFKGGNVIADTWDKLHRGVLKADFLRYLLLFKEGGVYSDIDTEPIRPIEFWGTSNVEYVDISVTDGPDWLSSLANQPSVIVGVEIDVTGLKGFKWNWFRPVQVCQWTLAGAPFHPIYLDAIKRVVNATTTVDESGIKWGASGQLGQKEDLISVLEWSGPPMFSDAVMQYLLSRYQVSWNRLRGIRHPLRIGDVLVLPNTAFAPGAAGADNSQHRQANVRHHWRGSWKTKGDVFRREDDEDWEDNSKSD